MSINQDYIGHIHTRRQDLSAVIICDKDYPRRVAYAVLNQVLDDFIQRYPRDRWPSLQFPLPAYPELKEMVSKYQDPHQADNLLRVQKELDDTKIIMVCPG
jgi:synaptobrevin family protein YKT6